VARVLADPAMTREVIVAAARALDVLYGPNPTVDGDDPAMVARTQIAGAFVDAKPIREGVTA
jgi:DNA-directed RNA polymerase subunit K/omega